MKFKVKAYGNSGWQDVGTVEVQPGADEGELERVLQRVKIYAPRGDDRLQWDRNGRRAVIYDGNEYEIVRLEAVTAAREGMREEASPADVLRTLQPGDMVTIESLELPRPRKVVVTHVGQGTSVYVTSGQVRPGHRGGGRLHVHNEAVFYDPTIQQRPVRVSRLVRTRAVLAEAPRRRHP